MRISTGEISSLLSGRPASEANAIKTATRRDTQPSQCGREVARVNELRCVAAVAKWGHLRICWRLPESA